MRAKLLKGIKGKDYFFKVLKIKIGKKESKKAVLETPETVGILPLLDKDKIVLISQYRFPIKREIWEIPAGKLKKNEDPKIGAKRELKEETGFEAEKIKKIGEFFLSPGYSSEYMHLFKAESLKKGKQKLNKGEMIKQVKVFSLNEALKMIKEKKIIDAKTIIAILTEKFNLT